MKKRAAIIVLALALLICGALIIQAISVYDRLTKHIDGLGVYSIGIDPYTDMEPVENLTDKDCIENVSRLMREASFCGLIPERSIVRSAEKRYIRVLMVAADNRCYEIQLTDENYDECYIRPLTGLYSENCYIKISNCQNLYEYVWGYIEAYRPGQPAAGER